MLAANGTPQHCSPECRRREGEGLPFSEEVLVGRGDIDERRERMAELEAQAGVRWWLSQFCSCPVV